MSKKPNQDKTPAPIIETIQAKHTFTQEELIALVDKVSSGYEFRPTECIVIFDPKNRSKDYLRRNGDGEPGEFIERREMTTADFQLPLPGQE